MHPPLSFATTTTTKQNKTKRKKEGEEEKKKKKKMKKSHNIPLTNKDNTTLYIRSYIHAKLQRLHI